MRATGFYLTFVSLFVFSTMSPGATRQSIAPTRITLPNGARLIVLPEPGNGLIALSMMVRNGLAEEGNRTGISLLTARSLLFGGLNVSRDRTARIAEEIGGNLDLRWMPDRTQIQCITSREGFPDAIYLLGQAIEHAELSQESIETARPLVSSDQNREATDPYRLAYAVIRENLNRDSPLRLPFGGSPDSVRRLGAREAKQFYETWYSADRVVVSIVGDITLEEARAAFERCFKRNERPAQPTRSMFTKAADNPPGLRLVRKGNATTGLVMAGAQGPGLTDPDYPALLALNALVGGGKGSRLFSQLRTDQSLGYIVASTVEGYSDTSHLLAYVEYDPSISTGNEKAIAEERIEQSLASAMQSVSDFPPTEEEVARAKQFAAGQMLLQRERRLSRAEALAHGELLAGGFDKEWSLPERIRQVTREQVIELAKRVLKQRVVVVVRPRS